MSAEVYEIKSIETELLLATNKINNMTKTIHVLTSKLSGLERQLQQEQSEKNDIQRDYYHIIDLVQEHNHDVKSVPHIKC